MAMFESNLKGNYYWRGPFLTSMIMGGSVGGFTNQHFVFNSKGISSSIRIHHCFKWLLTSRV